MDKKKVLVLLSTYNGQTYLNEQIDSILNQKTSHQVDLMVRDDGSTDGTIEILKEYERKMPLRVKVCYEKNIGYLDSFFELIKKAEGYDYYALSDQDDVWLEEKIDVAVAQCEACSYEGPLLYGSSSFLVNDHLEVMGETQKNLKGITWDNLLIQNIFPGHSQVFNDSLCQILKADIDCSRIYVHDFWITYVALLFGKVIFDNQSHTLYRQHRTNTVGFGKNSIEWICERLKRIGNNDNKKIAAQIHYFHEQYEKYMSEDLKKEISAFIQAQNSFWSRLSYLRKTPLHRQKDFETLLFRILYLLGGYKLS